CSHLVGLLPRDHTITSITECLVNSLSCFETHLIHELIETIKHRKLLLFGDVECSLDEVIKWVSNLALESRANTANNRLGNFPILIAQEAEFRECPPILHLNSGTNKSLFRLCMELQIVLHHILKASLRHNVCKHAAARELAVYAGLVKRSLIVVLSLDLEVVVRVGLVEDIEIFRQLSSQPAQLILTSCSHHAHISCQAKLLLGAYKSMIRIANSINRRHVDNRLITYIS